MKDFYVGLRCSLPPGTKPRQLEREMHGCGGSCGTSVLCGCRHLVLIDVLEGSFCLMSNKPLRRAPFLSSWGCTPASAGSLEHHTRRTSLVLPCLSACVPNRLYPSLPLLRTEALWGGIVFQFSLYTLIKMQLILKTEMMWQRASTSLLLP